jgi:3-oxoacyl-[acyl-carrier-protein] synthase II
MIGILSAEDALKQSGLLESGTNPKRIGVVIGTTGTGFIQELSEEDPQRILKNMTNAPASWVSIRNGIEGPSSSVSTACSSGAYAINNAIMYLLTGQCNAVVCGSSESIINQLDVGGFASLMAISTYDGDPALAARPFDFNRDGFVMGEGSGMLVLERWEHAQARGATILAETWLPGLSSEAYSIMSPQAMGTGMADCIRGALANAKLQGGDIGYINAHGTATQLNDHYETLAIKDVFGEQAYSIPISSTKAMTGHILSGAAGVEAVISILAMREGFAPPTLNLSCPDPLLDLNFVPSFPQSINARYVMSNSFAFGGHNGTCIFGRVD